MERFDSGVSSYITGTATIKVHFPVDSKGVADISCMQCQFLSSSGKYCQLNKKIVAFPNKFVGNECPLETEDYNDIIGKALGDTSND